MQFKLSRAEKYEFQELIGKNNTFVCGKTLNDRHWTLFWTWLDSGNFPVDASLTNLSLDYFNELLSDKRAVLTPEQFLNELSDLFAETRSDVTEIISEYLSGTLPMDWKTWREHRFITFKIPPEKHAANLELECEYDTLTGYLEVYSEDGTDDCNWHKIEASSYKD